MGKTGANKNERINMTKTNINSKKGFTIIEVTLVLAIGGLIMMMVFLALPALQRAQRDTQRTDDVSRLITQLNQYESNNRGKLPGSTEAYVTMNEDFKLQNAPTTSASKAEDNKWYDFYNEYMLNQNGGANSTDVFEDPSGGPYNLYIQLCDAAKGEGTKACPGTDVLDNFEDQSYTLHIYLNAFCDNDLPSYVKGSRKLAVVYKKEGGGRICQGL